MKVPNELLNFNLLHFKFHKIFISQKLLIAWFEICKTKQFEIKNI